MLQTRHINKCKPRGRQVWEDRRKDGIKSQQVTLPKAYQDDDMMITMMMNYQTN